VRGGLIGLLLGAVLGQTLEISEYAETPQQNLFSTYNIPDGTAQLIVVTAKETGVNTGETFLYEKDGSGVWQKIAGFGCFIGKGGFSDEKLLEGKEFTPVGLFAVDAAFGTADNPGTMPYIKIAPDDVWVDDPESELYNTLQKRGDNNGRWLSAERMNIAAYRLGFVIGYNTAGRTPYAGSAFFFHVYDKPTAGCVGVNADDALYTLKWLDDAKNPMILMGLNIQFP
jgi:L,D-peptidoglycan transpeptidase YkuD (ErfK/YbiS/YcfS/YnhG family)